MEEAQAQPRGRRDVEGEDTWLRLLTSWDDVDMGLYLKRARVQAQMLGDSNFHRARYADLGGY